jgi:hypothetical protein
MVLKKMQCVGHPTIHQEWLNAQLNAIRVVSVTPAR